MGDLGIRKRFAVSNGLLDGVRQAPSYEQSGEPGPRGGIWEGKVKYLRSGSGIIGSCIHMP